MPGIGIFPFLVTLQETFVFSAAIMTDASAVNAAKALIEFLRTPQARAVTKASGWSRRFRDEGAGEPTTDRELWVTRYVGLIRLQATKICS